MTGISGCDIFLKEVLLSQKFSFLMGVVSNTIEPEIFVCKYIPYILKITLFDFFVYLIARTVGTVCVAAYFITSQYFRKEFNG